MVARFAVQCLWGAVADAVQATYERSVEMTENLDNKDSSAVKRGE